MRRGNSLNEQVRRGILFLLAASGISTYFVFVLLPLSHRQLSRDLDSSAAQKERAGGKLPVDDDIIIPKPFLEVQNPSKPSTTTKKPVFEALKNPKLGWSFEELRKKAEEEVERPEFHYVPPDQPPDNFTLGLYSSYWDADAWKIVIFMVSRTGYLVRNNLWNAVFYCRFYSGNGVYLGYGEAFLLSSYKLGCPKPSGGLHPVYLDVLRQDMLEKDGEVKWLLKFEDVIVPEEPKDYIAVCMEFEDEPFEHPIHLVSFIEYYRLMGVSKFFFWLGSQLDPQSEMKTTIEKYESNGIIKRFRWDPNKALTSTEQLMHIPLNECLYRTASKFKFVIVGRKIELMVPVFSEKSNPQEPYLVDILTKIGRIRSSTGLFEVPATNCFYPNETIDARLIDLQSVAEVEAVLPISRMECDNIQLNYAGMIVRPDKVSKIWGELAPTLRIKAIVGRISEINSILLTHIHVKIPKRLGYGNGKSMINGRIPSISLVQTPDALRKVISDLSKNVMKFISDLKNIKELK